jgi:ABC-2 type transport system ATP-binding protein
VSGPAVALETFLAGRRTSDRRQMASQASAVVFGALDDDDCAWARALRLQLEPLSLQQVVVYAAGRPEPEVSEARKP